MMMQGKDNSSYIGEVRERTRPLYTVRPPLSGESVDVAELILQSDCGMLSALFGPSVKSLLMYLHERPGNPYSSASSLVVADVEGSRSIIGAMVGSLARATRGANLRTAGQLFRWYGPAVIARLPGLVRAGRSLDGLEPDDFYLSHIAVVPERRGRGAGAYLLRAAEEHARNLGAGRVVLDVEERNARARAFYARLDYREVSPVRIDLRRMGVFSFLRLSKVL
jgi:ribosomal protein S18 acetylase RimI-like enzyme